jgi:hypothetical protein
MGFEVFMLRICLYFLLLVSPFSSAEFSKVDWLSSGDELVTRDSETGLEWLDLSLTFEDSYNTVVSQLNGGVYNGWRLATKLEVQPFVSKAFVDFSLISGTIAINSDALVDSTGFKLGYWLTKTPLVQRSTNTDTGIISEWYYFRGGVYDHSVLNVKLSGGLLYKASQLGDTGEFDYSLALYDDYRGGRFNPDYKLNNAGYYLVRDASVLSSDNNVYSVANPPVTALFSLILLVVWLSSKVRSARFLSEPQRETSCFLAVSPYAIAYNGGDDSCG